MKPIAEGIRHIQHTLAASCVGPVGTISFRLLQAALFDVQAPPGVIFEAASGAQVFRIERSSDLKILFYHWSPILGSRVAAVDLRGHAPTLNVGIQFTWHPDRTSLIVHPLGTTAGPLQANGVATTKSFRVGRNGSNGSIVQIGDDVAEVTGARFTIEGENILQPTALEIWQETKRATELLRGGNSDEGYSFDVAISNAVLGSLVTGAETFCKYRFLELHAEGVTFNPKGVSAIARFKSNDKEQFLRSYAEALPLTRNEILYKAIETERRINFQNLRDVKRAFKGSYGIVMDMTEERLKMLAAHFVFRHRTVHVSPMITIYSRDGEPQHPILAGRGFIAGAMQLFDDFISTLQQSSLETLRAMERKSA